MGRAQLTSLLFLPLLLPLLLGSCLRTTEFCEGAADCDPGQICSKDSFRCVLPVLTVNRAGKGGGTVSSADGKIDCGARCSAGFAVGTRVTLSAQPESDSVLDSWSGCDPGTACQVTVPAQEQVAVTATFISAKGPRYTLFVNKQGHWNGTVRSDPGHSGIDCGAACQADFLAGATVTLQALPDANAALAGPAAWQGCQPVAADPGLCTVTLTTATQIFVQFASKQWSPSASPLTNDLYGIWGDQADDIFASGAGLAHASNVLLRFNGTAWSQEAPSYMLLLDPLLGVHGSGRTDIWAVGRSEGILHWDGGSWTQKNGFLSLPQLRGVWASGPGDAWAVGDGIVLHFDGSNWNADNRVNTSKTLSAVSGAGPADVWTCGDGGMVLHYDGTAWDPVPGGTTGNLYGIYAAPAAGPQAIWAGGDGGTVQRFDGKSWTAPQSGTQARLNAACGNASDDVWFAGVGGTLLHCNAQSCVPVPSGTSRDLYGLFCQAPGNVWAVGQKGTILRYGP